MTYDDSWIERSPRSRNTSGQQRAALLIQFCHFFFPKGDIFSQLNPCFCGVSVYCLQLFCWKTFPALSEHKKTGLWTVLSGRPVKLYPKYLKNSFIERVVYPKIKEFLYFLCFLLFQLLCSFEKAKLLMFNVKDKTTVTVS